MTGHKLLSVLDAPSNLGLSPPAEGSEPGVRRLAEAIGTQVDRSRLCIVLGGDCSILIGAMLALRRRGRFGLLFVDGHLDFRHPDNSALMSAAAGEELALVTGRGAPVLTDIGGLRPYVRDPDIVALGEREHDLQTADIYETEIHVVDLAGSRALGGSGPAVRYAVDRLTRRGIDGFWIHLDIDVLDSALMPAVDSPQPDGLTYEDLSELLGVAVSSPLAVGLEITIFDPDRDPDGALAARLTDAIIAGFRRGGI